MKRLITTLLALVCTFFVGTASAGTVASYWIQGTINDHTTTSLGLLIWIDSGLVPTQCTGNWLLIPEANKTMIAVTLLAIATNNRANFTAYTNYNPAYSMANGYCTLVQADPAN